MSKPKIIIIEDELLFCDMLKALLSPYYKIVSTNISPKNMLELYKKYKPDLILTEAFTKDKCNGITYAKELKEIYKDKVKVLAITGIPEITFLAKAKKYNIDGLIYKNINFNTLVYSINQVLNGYTLFPDNCNIYENIKKFKGLSEKEIRIIKLLCEAKERNEIADELNISSGTLKNNITTILNKLDFDNINKLTIYCLANGYIVQNENKKN